MSLGNILLTSLIFKLYLLVPGVVAFQGEQVAKSETPEATVTVELASGRAVTAELDHRTDSRRLWLRTGGATQYILRPIEWGRVVGVQMGAKTLTRDEFYQQVVPEQPDVSSGAKPNSERRIVIRGRPPEVGAADDTPIGQSYSRLAILPLQRTGSGPRYAARVRSLAIDAQVANWDADPEVDGLIVDIYPLDADGQVVPIRGTLQVHLTGWRKAGSRPRPAFQQIGRWSRRVKRADFDHGAARYKLTFQAVHPEFDLEWSSHGEVYARLGAPGHGAFAAIASAVRIRPYSMIRDRLEQVSGRRFFH